MSRAKAALRKAQQIGDPDQVTAARDRLATARTAHQHAKNATTTHDTAGQHGDVTDGQPTTTKDEPTMNDQQPPHSEQDQGDEPRQERHRGGFPGFVNVNVVTGNATVGSQHDIAGNASNFDAAQVNDVIAAALGKVDRALKQAKRTTDQGRHQGTTNVVSGNDVVAQQNGWQFH